MMHFNHTMIFFKVERDHSMIEMCHLKNVIIFLETILSFVLSRKILKKKYLYVKSVLSFFLIYQKLRSIRHVQQKNKLPSPYRYLNNVFININFLKNSLFSCFELLILLHMYILFTLEFCSQYCFLNN